MLAYHEDTFSCCTWMKPEGKKYGELKVFSLMSLYSPMFDLLCELYIVMQRVGKFLLLSKTSNVLFDVISICSSNSQRKKVIGITCYVPCVSIYSTLQPRRMHGKRSAGLKFTLVFTVRPTNQTSMTQGRFLDGCWWRFETNTHSAVPKTPGASSGIRR